jgi:hypothetical protein
MPLVLSATTETLVIPLHRQPEPGLSGQTTRAWFGASYAQDPVSRNEALVSATDQRNARSRHAVFFFWAREVQARKADGQDCSSPPELYRIRNPHLVGV